MDQKVIKFPGTPTRYPPHLSLIQRLKDYRKTDQSKANVQEMTDQFRIDTWRGEQVAQIKMLCRALARHADGGKEFAEMAALAAAEDIRKNMI